MTTKEKQLKVLEALGLKVDDKVEIEYEYTPVAAIIRENEYSVYLSVNDRAWNITLLINYDFIKIKSKKTYGELSCAFDIHCVDCPLQSLNCKAIGNNAYGNLEYLRRNYDKNVKYPMSEEVYNHYKRLLDKEVEDDR